jgi:hypothetical protein
MSSPSHGACEGIEKKTAHSIDLPVPAKRDLVDLSILHISTGLANDAPKALSPLRTGLLSSMLQARLWM